MNTLNLKLASVINLVKLLLKDKTIKRLSTTILRDALLTIYKSFIKPHSEYAGVTYNKPPNND